MAVGVREAGESVGRPVGKTAFWLLAGVFAALRLALAVRAPVLHEIEHIWQPMAKDLAGGALPWSSVDYHFFAPWAWLLRLFGTVSEAGVAFATVQRSFFALVDLGVAALVYRLAERTPGALPPRTAALLYLINPVAIYVSSVQAQFDGLAILFLLAALLFTVRQPEGRGFAAGVLLGLSLAAKQVTALHPLLWLRRRSGVLTAAVAYGIPLLTLAPHARSWRIVVRSLLVYYPMPVSYGLSELALWDSRFSPLVAALGLGASLAAIFWLRNRELVRSCLFLSLVMLFFACGLGSQYLLWLLPFGALFGGGPYLAFTAASLLWIGGSRYGLPGSGQFLGHVVWFSVGIWMFFESRALGARPVEAAA
jgi:hypothetical protein